MDWQNVLGAAAFIVAVGAISLVGLMRERLSNQGEAIAEFRARVDDLEKERALLRTDLAEAQSEARVLKATVLGKVEWVAISDQLEEHHRQAIRQWAGMNTRLDTLHADLAALKKRP